MARRFTRVPYESEVLINSKGQWYRGMSDNLSLYGIYVKSGNSFPLNSQVELTIPLTGEDEYIDVIGLVVRQDGDGIGCEFQQVDVDAFLYLKNIVSSRCDNKSLVMDEFYSYLAKKELSVAL